jgi:hypothetical protein
MRYLLRFAETGRDVQRGKLRRDLTTQLLAQLPSVHFDEVGAGRLLVKTPEDARSVLAALHGIVSFSPCQRCTLDELASAALAFSAQRLAHARSFAVAVRRVGRHDFRSSELAAELGARVGAALRIPVDLRRPERVLGVEIRQNDCYLFDEVIPGRDAVATPPAAAVPMRFLVDQMLGRLSTWLRLLGFDTLYVRDEPDSVLVRRAADEGRVLLTRDRLLARVFSARVYLVQARELPAQVREVVQALRLPLRKDALFSRCTLCNRPVEEVDKESVRDRVPEAALQQYERFTYCAACDKIYWPGSHHERVLAQLGDLLQ